jgi:hypothetical protein
MVDISPGGLDLLVFSGMYQEAIAPEQGEMSFL